jgi:uncharacterized protein YdeI (YjbR/CyaY-like superfamily)
MAPVVVNPDHVREFATQADFEAWLAANHDSAGEVWIRMFKKITGRPTVSTLEAIDSVLCWGWIDAIRKSWDEVSFVQRYTPRGKKSLWSQVNRDNVARLEAAGRMTEHGRRHVDAAKADGRWDAAYAAGSKMEMPEDLLAAIAAEPAAQATFDTLNKTNRFALAFRVGNLKTPAGRQKRITAFVEMLSRGETIYPQKPRGAAAAEE